MAILKRLAENTRIYPLSQVNQALLNKQTHAVFMEELYSHVARQNYPDY